jgi:hypothetical protein
MQLKPLEAGGRGGIMVSVFLCATCLLLLICCGIFTMPYFSKFHARMVLEILYLRDHLKKLLSTQFYQRQYEIVHMKE